MKQILMQLLFAAPAIWEALLIDPIFWKHGKSDKPASTIGRVIIAIFIGWLTQFAIVDNWALLGILGVVVWYVAIFNYLVNWVLGEYPSYRQNWWIFGHPAVKLILLLSFIIIYLTFNSTINEGASMPFNLPLFR